MSDRLLFPEFEMPFRQFQADREVQTVLLTIRHWGGETVRGDLMAYALAYHHRALAHEAELILPFVPDWVQEFEGMTGGTVSGVDGAEIAAVEGLIERLWRPFREIVERWGH